MPIHKTILGRLEKNDQTLTKLDLTRHYPGITDIEIGHLAIALKNNRYLDSLILSENAIGDEGAKMLAEVLPTTSITMLDLSTNQIGNEGANALFAVNASSLTCLYLGGNHIDKEGIANINNNHFLRTLVIDGNNIDDEGMQVIFQNTTLIELIFDDDEVTSELANQINKHISDNIKIAIKRRLKLVIETVGQLPDEEIVSFVDELKRHIDTIMQQSKVLSSFFSPVSKLETPKDLLVPPISDVLQKVN